MTTRRAAQHPTSPAQPVERPVAAALAVAVVAGLAWTGGMVWTLLGWQV